MQKKLAHQKKCSYRKLSKRNTDCETLRRGRRPPSSVRYSTMEIRDFDSFLGKFREKIKETKKYGKWKKNRKRNRRNGGAVDDGGCCGGGGGDEGG
ncbi:hypothetical protein L484_016030 [Morus notabilis]|uniref:Uncharacterized protein n=1 Tax=Morus notabilis TaxID=981085 RepID=W9SD30_9ROSA|nr:hypothetical protein L484_016030 [Morus notabilis]